MSLLQKIVYWLPVAVQKIILRFLYSRKGASLEDFRSYNNQFYIYTVNGISVPSESIGWFVNYEYYDEWVNTLCTAFYKPVHGDVILDIGAGMGEECIVFSRMVGDAGKVYCIEANPVVYNVLQDIIFLNDLRNVKAYNLAISTRNESLHMEMEGSTFLGGKVSAEKEGKDKNYFTVQGKRLDDFVAEEKILRIDLLKVNIEGAERFVIETMDNIISITNNVAISCHDFRFRHEGGNEFFRTKDLVKKYLLSNGFEVHALASGVEHKDDWIFGKKSFS